MSDSSEETAETCPVCGGYLRREGGVLHCSRCELDFEDD